MSDCINAKEALLGVWKGGYGHYQIHKFRRGRHRKTVMAHRHVYEECFGPIPEGLIVMHTCDTPACVNPEHLKVGTNAENSADMKARGRSTRGEKHAMRKLTSEQVARIRALSREERSSRSLAVELGVTKETINSIRSGRSW